MNKDPQVFLKHILESVEWIEKDMRNKLIHGYFGVDLKLVWSVIKNDLPPLASNRIWHCEDNWQFTAREFIVNG